MRVRAALPLVGATHSTWETRMDSTGILSIRLVVASYAIDIRPGGTRYTFACANRDMAIPHWPRSLWIHPRDATTCPPLVQRSATDARTPGSPGRDATTWRPSAGPRPPRVRQPARPVATRCFAHRYINPRPRPSRLSRPQRIKKSSRARNQSQERRAS